MTPQEIAEAIQAHAWKHYEESWDIIAEAWTVSEIAQELEGECIDTVEEALTRFQEIVDLHQEMALNTRFGDEW